MVELGASSLLLDLSELTYLLCHGCAYVVCVLEGGGGVGIFVLESVDKYHLTLP